MDHTHLLLRPGEIFLKGKNQRIFENKLVSNIQKITGNEVQRLRFRFLLDYFPEHRTVKQVFGLTSYSCAVKIERDKDVERVLEQIKKVANELVADKLSTFDTSSSDSKFKVETKRSDKSFSIKSPELNQKIGIHLQQSHPELELSFKAPEFLLNVEINTNGIYIFTGVVTCHGGLPTGVEGKVVLLIDNSSKSSFDASILAGLMFMKRGSDVAPVIVGAEGSNIDISLLQNYSPAKLELQVVSSVTDVAKLSGFAVVSGQNYDNYQELDVVGDSDKLLFRPLIAFSDVEIKKELKKFVN